MASLGSLAITLAVEFEFRDDSWKSRFRQALVRLFARVTKGKVEVRQPIVIHFHCQGVDEVREAIQKVINETQRYR